MRAGRLDRQITLQRLTETQDDFGQVIDVWDALATVWASRESQRVIERFQAQQRFASAEVVFRVRWYPFVAEIDTKFTRILYADRTYNILGVEEIGRKEGLHILATSRTDLGGLP